MQRLFHPASSAGFGSMVPSNSMSVYTVRPALAPRLSTILVSGAKNAKKKTTSVNAAAVAVNIHRTASAKVLNEIVNTGRMHEGAMSDSDEEMVEVTHKKYYGARPCTHRCLVLDSAFRPVNVVTWNRAVMLDVSGKAEVVVYYEDAYAVSGMGLHQLPAVIQVGTYVNMDAICSRVACTRRNVFVRDRFQCQYCGVSHNLTVDHVKPVCLGGKSTWTNLVTACLKCNQKKGHTLLHALPGFRLRREPMEPTTYDLGIVAGLSTSDISSPPEEWVHFLQPYIERANKLQRLASEAGV